VVGYIHRPISAHDLTFIGGRPRNAIGGNVISQSPWLSIARTMHVIGASNSGKTKFSSL
jgi:hypothetical protein